MASGTFERLNKASDEVIRQVLTALCESDNDIREKASKCLDAFESEEMYQSHVDGSERQRAAAGIKRKAEEAIPEVYICENCGEGFLEELNNDKACFHHPGYLEVDDVSDFWADHDEDCHGTIDTEEMRKAFPDGFRWDCCDQPGDGEKGCTYARHENVAAKRRKTKGDMARTVVSIDLTND